MTTAHPERIAIIGGGFSGVMETVAGPELRSQARRVAEAFLDHPETAEPEVMMEYMI